MQRNRPGYKQILANDIYNAQVLDSQAKPPFACHTLCSSDRVERRRREHSETANAHLRSLNQEEERELHHLAKARRERTFPTVAHETAFKGEKSVYWPVRQLTLQGLATHSNRLSDCGGTVSF
jgi:hypothetical protein